MGGESDPGVPGVLDQPRFDDGRSQWIGKIDGLEDATQSTGETKRCRRSLVCD